MNLQPIASLDDPRVAVYRNLKDRDVAAEGDRFIAEGEHVVRRLLASDFPVESLLLAERRVAELGALAPAGVPVYAAPDELLAGIVGFKFHSGVLGCGRRKANPTLEEILGPPLEDRTNSVMSDTRKNGPTEPGSVVEGDSSRTQRPVTLVICPEIINTDNLGSLIRISAAFGVDAMITGERSCDPFWRRSIRVSMGTVFRLPLIRSNDLLRDLLRMKREWGVEMVGTVVDDAGAQPLERAGRPGGSGTGLSEAQDHGRDAHATFDRLGLLFGSESQGLHRRWLGVCDRRVTIPMELGTDSLNVAVAAGVFLYHFMRGWKRG